MLDESFFSLHVHFVDSEKLEYREPAAIDDDHTPAAVYQIHRDESTESYTVREPISGTQLAQARTLSNKLRLVELLNPPSKIECKYSGLLSFEQQFDFENYQFEWKRSSPNVLSSSHEKEYTLWMKRKPEPDWLVATFRPGGGHRSLAGVLQMLDHQLRRVDMDDLKGFEVVVCTLLSMFLEFRKANDAAASAEPRPAKEPLRAVLTGPLVRPEPSESAARPAPTEVTNGIRIETSEPNDLTVRDHVAEGTYIETSLKQLGDPALAYVTFRAQTKEMVPKAIRIAAEVKTRHMRATGEELFQYVRFDSLIGQIFAYLPTQVQESRPEKTSHIPRIDLRPENHFEALKAVQIWLSRIPLDELAPRPLLDHGRRPNKLQPSTVQRQRTSPPISGRSNLSFMGRRSPVAS